MARININVGTNANDGTGDDLRSAMQKINTNFTELYGTTAEANDLVEDGSPQLGGDLDVNGHLITSASNGNISIVPNGTGTLTLAALTVNGTTISSSSSSKITLAESVDVTGTLSAAIINVNILQSDDSTAIQVADSVNISGTLNVKDLIVNEISSDDSTAVEIKDKLNVQGLLSASTINTNIILSNDSSEIQVISALSVSGTLSASTINTNVIASGDSTAIQIQDSLNISGLLNGFQLPTLDGINGQVLQTNGSGILSFVTIGGGGGGSILTLVGDDSTGTVINNDRTIKFLGGNNITTTVTGDTITFTGSKNINVNEISSGDSSAIQIVDNVNITGTLNAKTIVANDLISEDSTAINVLDGLNVSGTLSVDTMDVNEISSGDSTAIQVNDAMNITGTLTANTFVTNNISSSESTAVSIQDGLSVSGILSAATMEVSNISSSDSTVIVVNDGLHMMGNKIQNLADPVTNQEAATKKYVDDQVAAVVGSGGGFTVTGDDSTGTLINLGESFKINGGTGLTSVVTGDVVNIAIDSTVATLTDGQTLTNKTLTAPVFGGIAASASGNIVLQPFSNILEIRGNSGTVGQIQLNCPVNTHGQRIASQPHAQAATNTLTLPGGTTIGNSDAVLVSDTGTQTLTNKTISLASNTLTGTTAQFNTALSDGDFATLSGAETLTNKTINGANNTLTNIPNAALVNTTMNFSDATSTSIPLALGDSMAFAGGNNITALIAGNTLTISLSKNIDVNEITSTDSSAIQINDSINVSGTVTSAALVTNEISSGDSTAIQVNDGVNITGTLTANTFVTNNISSSESSAIQINDSVNVAGTLTTTNLVASNISAPASATGTYTISSPSTITLSPASEVLNTAAFTLFSRTVAQLSALTASAGAMVYCTNETGGSVPVFYDGTNWRRVTDRNIAS